MTSFGSAPHHQRVLAVVLVVTADADAPPVTTHVLKPHTPEWDAFWHDIGRPDKGPERTPKAPVADECVQPACPTCRGRRFITVPPDTIYDTRGFRYLPCPACYCGHVEPEPEPASKDSFRDGVSAGWSASQRRDPFPEEAEPASKPKTLDAFNEVMREGLKTWPAAIAEHERKRAELLELLSPLDHPYPEEGTT